VYSEKPQVKEFRKTIDKLDMRRSQLEKAERLANKVRREITFLWPPGGHQLREINIPLGNWEATSLLILSLNRKWEFRFFKKTFLGICKNFIKEFNTRIERDFLCGNR
jgi:hypothetical protein